MTIAWEGRNKTAPPRPAMDAGMEPGADLEPAEGGLPRGRFHADLPEAIYEALYVEGRGALKRELVACLRTGRPFAFPDPEPANALRGT
jgi:hypothetical protein